ncbi:MAG: HD domain-containing protein [Gammaproteobacteria bacterium]|nr:HD domain-containing protein [Gammaproteobacteria bacterium]
MAKAVTNSLLVKDLEVGSRLPWDVYDKYGMLLLKEDSVIVSGRQLQALVARGIYRKKSRKEMAQEQQKGNELEDDICPFDVVYEYCNRLDNITDSLQKNAKNRTIDIEQTIRKLCAELQAWANTDSDALLGAVHLCFGSSYSLMHAIHVAILCELIGKRFIEDSQRRNTIMCAALTCNIAINDLQDSLQKQSEMLTDGQRQKIDSHPERAVKILHDNGITNSLWLKSVLQHHERIDGGGYPGGVSGDALLTESNLISIADRYAAMIAGRSYRKGIHPKEVLKQIFVDRGKFFYEKLCLFLIKELGIFPPGAFVSLNNGEVGIVINRALDSVTPVVASIISPRGAPYPQPIRRDCQQESYKIIQICELDKNISLNLPVIWGYR